MVSIVIVNYNVKYFLEQCLFAVRKAIIGLDAEIIVVDNNSSDGSLDYLQTGFKDVCFYLNTKNTGFAHANNLGWKMAMGDMVLFLNPDTIISEDSINQSLRIFENLPNVGALGIRMIDGCGNYLPESKRGFPGPAASFYKICGLSRLFPASPVFSRYYLGQLPNNQDNRVDVLSGAFMMLRKSVLEKTNGFDETFFMYGEDIDLSFRVQQCGYINYYLANTSIIHFKGESTPKDKTYIRHFHNAMLIFVKKHYKQQSWWFSGFIQMAIMAKAGISFLSKMVYPGRNGQVMPTSLNTIIIGSFEEIMAAKEILGHYNHPARNIINRASLEEIAALLTSFKPDEIIFCTGSIGYKDIIRFIQDLPKYISFRFFTAGGKSVISSISKNSIGEILV